jgi:urease accessory protein
MPATTTTEQQLYRLLVWFSPAMPVGAYSYSHGLEAAVGAGLVCDGAMLRAYVETALRHGAGQVDAAWLGAAHRACLGREWEGWPLERVLANAAAMRPTRELALESTGQGRALLAVLRKAWPAPELDRLAAMSDRLGLTPPHAVVAAVAAACHGMELGPAALAFLHGFAANLISAGIRLIPLGQTDGQKLTAALEPIVREIAQAAVEIPPDEIGSAAPMIDLCSIAHETQYTRLFRS